MYLTNNPEVAAIAQDAGVARIVVDMEYIGKDKRQRGMNTSRNYHSIEDVKKLRPIIDNLETRLKKDESLYMMLQSHKINICGYDAYGYYKKTGRYVNHPISILHYFPRLLWQRLFKKNH